MHPVPTSNAASPQQQTWGFTRPTRSDPLQMAVSVPRLAAGAAMFITLIGVRALHGNPILRLLAAVIAVGVYGVFIFGRVYGRPIDEWVAPAVRQAQLRVRKQHTWTAPDQAGTTPPPAAAGWQIRGSLVTPRKASQAISFGVMTHPADKTYVLVCRADSAGFYLRTDAEQINLIAGWGALLDSAAAWNSPLHRLQWIERVAWADATQSAVVDHFEQHGMGNTAAGSYRQLLDEHAGEGLIHETYVALAVTPQSAARQIKDVRQKHPNLTTDTAMIAVLWHQADQLRKDLNWLHIQPLSVAELSALVRSQFDPFFWLDRPEAGMWPTDTELRDGMWRTDDTWHHTAWVSQLPPTIQTARHLGDMLFSPDLSNRPRTVSVTLKARDPNKALRGTNSRQITRGSIDAIKANWGINSTATDRIRTGQLDTHETELANQYAETDLSAFVTVHGQNPDDTREASLVAESVARSAGMALQPVYGQQDIGFIAAVLPTGKGRQ